MGIKRKKHKKAAIIAALASSPFFNVAADASLTKPEPRSFSESMANNNIFRNFEEPHEYFLVGISEGQAIFAPGTVLHLNENPYDAARRLYETDKSEIFSPLTPYTTGNSPYVIETQKLMRELMKHSNISAKHKRGDYRFITDARGRDVLVDISHDELELKTFEELKSMAIKTPEIKRAMAVLKAGSAPKIQAP